MITLVRFLLGSLLLLTSLFLILLVLIQRGRGGGLAGAFGGAGGQSAFGTKAGDTFTKITIGVAAFWILLCILSINVLATPRSRLSGSLGSDAPMAVEPGPGQQSEAESVDPAAPVDPGAAEPSAETSAPPAADAAAKPADAAPAEASPSPPPSPDASPEAAK